MLLWALRASGQFQMRKVDGCQTLSQPIEPMPLDLAAWEHEPSHSRSRPPGNFNSVRDATPDNRTRSSLSRWRGS